MQPKNKWQNIFQYMNICDLWNLYNYVTFYKEYKVDPCILTIKKIHYLKHIPIHNITQIKSQLRFTWESDLKKFRTSVYVKNAMIV